MTWNYPVDFSNTNLEGCGESQRQQQEPISRRSVRERMSAAQGCPGTSAVTWRPVDRRVRERENPEHSRLREWAKGETMLKKKNKVYQKRRC